LLSLLPRFARPIPRGMFSREKIAKIFQVFDPLTEAGEFGSQLA
jgi:hypothetical protein